MLQGNNGGRTRGGDNRHHLALHRRAGGGELGRPSFAVPQLRAEVESASACVWECASPSQRPEVGSPHNTTPPHTAGEGCEAKALGVK